MGGNMHTSKVTQRGQATIPSIIRQKLNLNTGDSIAFDINEDGQVILHKIEPVDILFLQSLNSSLGDEWNSQEDSGAYDDL
jgi:AbrB family looped-hinge helix DNA binding protein